MGSMITKNNENLWYMIMVWNDFFAHAMYMYTLAMYLHSYKAPFWQLLCMNLKCDTLL